MDDDSQSERDALDCELYQALQDDEDGPDSEVSEQPSPKRQRIGGQRQEAAEAARLSQNGDFNNLSEDLTLQVLACTSAADLAAVAQSSKYFRAAAADNDLWRPLYTARWGNKLEESNKLQDSLSWKEKYMDHDAQDVAEIKERVPQPIQLLYLQMATAKRTLRIPRRRILAQPSDVALKGRISRWRGLRGLLKCPAPELGMEHEGCVKKGPFARLEGSLFMCESCGWAHVCGENCSERFVDIQAELLVCPVSGRCFDIILDDFQEEGQEEHGAYDFGTAGHWGRAYADGYNCGSEEELQTRCGACI